MIDVMRELDAEGLKHWQAHIEQQEKDIKLMAMHFEFVKNSYNSFEEADAYHAQNQINLARRRLIELQEEIEWQHHIIHDAQLIIKDFKKTHDPSLEKKAGKPQISESQKRIAKAFMAKWIHSLMDILEVKNCKKLEDNLETATTLNSERNWRRWLNGDAIPTYKSFETLLNSKVAIGKYAKRSILSIPTTPNPDDLLTLIRFI